MSQLPVPQGSLATYLVEINRFPLLSREEEQELAIRFREKGEIDAAHRLVTSNLRFVVKVAYEYARYGVRLSDLIQEGNIGLMQAVKKFDPYKGHKLITYAVWWIRAYIQNYILKTWSLVKIGTTQAQRKLFYKLRRTKAKLAALMPTGESLAPEETDLIAEDLKVRPNDVTEMESRLRARDASLDQPISAENDVRHLDLIPSSANQEEEISRREEQARLKSSLQEVLGNLNEREQFIVKNRLMSDSPFTLQEIGERYKISRERARQIEEATKRKLRSHLRREGDYNLGRSKSF